MAIPAYNVYGNRPRLFIRDTDKAAIVARTNDAAGWKSFWDNDVIPAADSTKGMSAAAIADDNQVERRVGILTLVGYIEETGRPGGGYKDGCIDALLEIAGRANADKPKKRNRLQSLALGFDFLYDDLTAGERDTLGSEILQQCARMSGGKNRLTGSASVENMLRFMGAVTVHGHGTLTAGAEDEIEKALGFYLSETTLQEGRLDEARFFSSDGGWAKGDRYCVREGLWPYGWFLWCLNNATDLDPWTDEAFWASKAWEFLIWGQYCGAGLVDHEEQNDTGRTKVPLFHEQHSWALGMVSELYPNPNGTQGGRHARWIWDQLAANDPPSGLRGFWDVVFFDKATNTAIHPKDGTPIPATSRLFDPPGIYFYRYAPPPAEDWDYDESVFLRITCPKWYQFNHIHLNRGAHYIRFKHDPLLLGQTGTYNFGEDDHVNWYQRSQGHSGCPLIHDPNLVYKRYGDVVGNDGGQDLKKFDDNGGEKSRGITVDEVINEGGGQAWLAAEEFEVVEETSGYIFLWADYGLSYRRKLGETGRADLLITRYLIIKPNAGNGLTWPVILVYTQIKKTNEVWETEIPFHFRNAITTTAYGFHSTGHFGVGKLWVDVRDIANYTLLNNPPGAGTPYGADQFRTRGTGTNHPPATSANDREEPWVKRHTLWLSRTNQAMEERYVYLLMPTAAGDPEPASGRAWVTDAAEPDYYGITIGSETYLVHRTQKLVVHGAPAAPDTTPPGEVTGLSLTPRDKAIRASWTDPGDSDLAKVNVYIRTSAT